MRCSNTTAARAIRLNDTHPWYVLIELSSQARTGLRDTMEAILADGVERGLVADAAIADSLEQSKAFWRIREMFGEVQRQVGGSIKHDIRCRSPMCRPSSAKPMPR